MVAVVVIPSVTGSLAAMPMAGDSWYLPPWGIRIVAAPMEASKRSIRPFLLQAFRSLR